MLALMKELAHVADLILVARLRKEFPRCDDRDNADERALAAQTTMRVITLRRDAAAKTNASVFFHFLLSHRSLSSRPESHLSGLHANPAR